MMAGWRWRCRAVPALQCSESKRDQATPWTVLPCYELILYAPHFGDLSISGVDIGAHASPSCLDFDGDGDVDFEDLITLLSSFGPCGVPCPTDLDGDNAVTFEDLLRLLSVWG